MRAIIALITLLLLAAAAYAAETIAYTYDARGRLKQVAHSGTSTTTSSPITPTTRLTTGPGKTTTGSPNPPPP